MQTEKGNLSINSENILPIIKKWLYSDKDIFLRELISNGCDAVTKLRKLASMGETSLSEGEKFRIDVVLDSKNKIIQVKDNGIGMTADEIKQYINQIAFSGAEDFLSRYKDKINKDNEIIGHFGLGFYSSFMVADKVEIDSLSYSENASPAKWTLDEGIEYEMSTGERSERGTTITLYVGEDSKEFLDEYTLKQILKKYCSFMPVEIYFEAIKEEDKKDESGDEPEILDSDDIEQEEITAEEPVNDISPLWLKQPKDCTDEEYKEFYHKVFTDFDDPLFWIHLNMDFPERLKGILYFPKLKNEMDPMEGQVKLYNNQVFVADNIKEVIPEFLLLLKGVIDCPDLPLNVSRSFLQNDGYASKMSGYISKKVGDKLNSLYKDDKEQYEKFWDDISIFIKYGCMKETKFYDKVKDILVYKSTKGNHVTLKEYLEQNKDKHENKVFYVTDEAHQVQYINMFKDEDMEALILSSPIDSAFISFLEMKENKTSFSRIDADLSDSLLEKGGENEASETPIKELFEKVLNNEKLTLKAQNLKTKNIPGILLVSEQSRRMKEMYKYFGNMPMPLEDEKTLVLNTNNHLIQKLLSLKDDESRNEDVKLICEHVYDLALMSQKSLTPEEMTAFIERNNKLLEKLV